MDIAELLLRQGGGEDEQFVEASHETMRDGILYRKGEPSRADGGQNRVEGLGLDLLAVVGESEDVDGKKGFVLTLSAREQHIRREKATSNICTNSGLCSLAFTIHLTLLGEKGFKGLSRLNHQSALNLREKILKISNIEFLNTNFFNEFTLSLPINGETFIERMAEKRVLAGIPVSRLIKSNNKTDNLIVVASTETNTEEDINKYIEVANEVLK